MQKKKKYKNELNDSEVISKLKTSSSYNDMLIKSDILSNESLTPFEDENINGINNS